MTDLIPDSTFFIFFLDDVQSPDYLLRIVTKFKTHIVPSVYNEIQKTKTPNALEQLVKASNKWQQTLFKIGDVLKPFFSEKERDRGEHEIIVAAYIFHECKTPYLLIVDEAESNRFLRNNLPHLNTCRTGAFISDCCTKHGIIIKKEALQLYDLMEKSNFRITKEALQELRKRVS